MNTRYLSGHRPRRAGGAVPMAPLLVAGLTVIAMACATAPATDGGGTHRTRDTDRREVIEAHLALVRAYEAGDLESFAGLLDPSPDLLVFHPYIENRFDGIEDVRENLGRMFARLGTASWMEFHPNAIVNGDVAWITTHVLLESPGLRAPFVGRGTEIWIRGETGWRLMHGHWSANPETVPAEG